MPNNYASVHKLRKQVKPGDKLPSYTDAHKERQKSVGLPESDKKTLAPDYLLGHENHFDPNVFTPEQQAQKIHAPEAVTKI